MLKASLDVYPPSSRTCNSEVIRAWVSQPYRTVRIGDHIKWDRSNGHEGHSIVVEKNGKEITLIGCVSIEDER